MDILPVLVYVIVVLSLVWALLRFTVRGMLWWIRKNNKRPVNYPRDLKWAGDPKILILIIAILLGALWLAVQIKYG